LPKAKLTDINKKRDAFVKGETVERPTVQTVNHLDLGTVKSPEVQKSERKQVTVYMPSEVHKRLKLRAVEQDKEISELVEQAVREFLDKAS
jgi:predicted HicB family RNase H-like nuclease